MISNIKLRWSSMNMPLDYKDYFWEIGTLVDFHVEPFQKKEKACHRFILDDLKITPQTKLIVTSIEDTKNTDRSRTRFNVTLYRFENGIAVGKPIMIPYLSAVCQVACYVGNVTTYMVNVEEAEEYTLGGEFGQVSTQKKLANA